MANDNQTALMQSLTRRKTELKKHKERYAKLGHNKNSITGHCLNATIEAYELQITEDEKLLAVEREQWVDAYAIGAFHFCELELDDPTIRKEGNDNYTQKYATDGK